MKQVVLSFSVGVCAGGLGERGWGWGGQSRTVVIDARGGRPYTYIHTQHMHVTPGIYWR